MPKNKPNKGLLKRIRITKSGRIKFSRAFGRHKRSHKSGKLMQSYHQPAYAPSCEAKRVRSMLFIKNPKVARPREASESAAESSS